MESVITTMSVEMLVEIVLVGVVAVDVVAYALHGLPVHGVVDLEKSAFVSFRAWSVLFPVLGVVGKARGFPSKSV